MQRLTTLHGSFNNDTRSLAAQALVNRCKGGVAQAFLSNSGTEANEAALKFAVLATGKKKFISCRGSYHGKTLGSLSATYSRKYRDPFEPLLWNFHHIDYNDTQQLEDAMDKDTAAFIVEPIQGEGGIIIPDPGYLKQVKELCGQKNVLLILDEIQTGAGRTGHLLASEEEVLAYDILVLGKGLAGGIPAGATLVSQKVGAKIQKSIHTSTFGGNPLAGAGILTTLEMLDEERLLHIRKTGDYFLSKLKKITTDVPMKVRGKGLMIGIEVTDKRNEILKKLQDEKILAVPAADNVIRFLPPYILEKEHVDMAVDALKNIFMSL